MIFQDPFASLHPMYRVGAQVSEAVRAHENISRRAARERAVELLDIVGIPRAREASRDYPHQFSGGIRQRALIAMALARCPHRFDPCDQEQPPLVASGAGRADACLLPEDRRSEARRRRRPEQAQVAW